MFPCSFYMTKFCKMEWKFTRESFIFHMWAIFFFLLSSSSSSWGSQVAQWESTCQCRRCKRQQFNSWAGKILWRMTRQPTQVFLPTESHAQSLVGYGPWSRRVGHNRSNLELTRSLFQDKDRQLNSR